MYFRVSIRLNPESQKREGYYRILETYRDSQGNVIQRTLLSPGFIDYLTTEQRREIEKILNHKIKHGNQIFNEQLSQDALVLEHVSDYYKKMVDNHKIDSNGFLIEPKQKQKDQKVYTNSIENKDVREIGAEWLLHQACEQLKIEKLLLQEDFTEEEVQLALTHIISRAVYPASELETSRWIQENSAVFEVTGYPVKKITKDKLYGISKKLFTIKQEIENHLSTRTNELFDIEDKIVLYDLTNTYFEGQKTDSMYAKFGRSKEKRSDCKIIVLALVVNSEGFIKYSAIHQGNMSDSKTLGEMIDSLRANSSVSTKNALVVIDAGIATDENLKKIKEKGYEYLCVTRSNLQKYKVLDATPIVRVKDNKNQTIELQKVQSEKHNDYLLHVHSQAKEVKECSMNEQFLNRFEDGLLKIKESTKKKGGVKLHTKVHQRIGRLQQQFPSIQKYFNIEVESDNEGIVTSVSWNKKSNIDINSRSGVYFLRTSLTDTSEETIWKYYNTIREIEATFRVLKTDLDLRPVYHKTDEATLAHLHLGILAYWLVNTVRHQLKSKNINSSWREIVRIMNTQKAVTTQALSTDNNIISIRQCSQPNQKVTTIYEALAYKHTPFTKKKFVVPKPEIIKQQNLIQHEFRPN